MHPKPSSHTVIVDELERYGNLFSFVAVCSILLPSVRVSGYSGCVVDYVGHYSEEGAAIVSEPQNPWLSRPIAPATPTPEIRPRPATPTTQGPSAPQRGVPAPDRVDQLGVWDQHAIADLWVLGAHGGAGESTLASLAPGWREAGRYWPRPVSGERSNVILTARSNARGLRAAQSAIRQWAAGLVPFADVVGLVVVADAPGRLPRPLRDLLQVVGGGVPRTWLVPWVEAWRLGEPLTHQSSPREAQRLVAELHAILEPGASRANT